LILKISLGVSLLKSIGLIFNFSKKIIHDNMTVFCGAAEGGWGGNNATLMVCCWVQDRKENFSVACAPIPEII
jgi:hypothetical protein